MRAGYMWEWEYAESVKKKTTIKKNAKELQCVPQTVRITIHMNMEHAFYELRTPIPSI